MRAKSSNQIPCVHTLRGFRDTAIHPDYDPPVLLLGQLPAPACSFPSLRFFSISARGNAARGDPRDPSSLLNDVSERGML